MKIAVEDAQDAGRCGAVLRLRVSEENGIPTQQKECFGGAMDRRWNCSFEIIACTCTIVADHAGKRYAGQIF